jgi:DNA adenine methylase
MPLVRRLTSSPLLAMLVCMRCPGGKGKLYHRLISLMPPHSTYIEAFAGGASILRHKRPAQLSIAVDRDLDHLAHWSKSRPPGALLVCADALEFLASYAFQGDELVYCDPPYLPSSRRRRRIYKFELSEEQHSQLLALLQSLSCRVMVSGYSSELYSACLGGWTCETFQVRTHASWATECVWFNFPRPEILHDARFLGDDFRQRHTVRRRLSRLQRRLRSLSTAEKGEVFTWLSDELRTTES